MNSENGTLKGYEDVEEYIFATQGTKCPLCGPATEHYHHMVPGHDGGSDGPDNIVGVCVDCHAKMHQGNDKEIADALKELGKKREYAALSVLNQAIPYISRV